MVTPLYLSRAYARMLRYKVATSKSDQPLADYRNSFKIAVTPDTSRANEKAKLSWAREAPSSVSMGSRKTE